jgi:hypothetical protein
MSEEVKDNKWALWIINIVVLSFIALLTWNANKLCADVEGQQCDINQLKRESVRWQIMAEDVREIKMDLKRLLQKQ